jgi:hypothetical protein
MPARKPAKKPFLTLKEKQWMNVIFSDESTFRIVNSKSVTLRRPITMNRYKSKFTISTSKPAAGAVVWGCYRGKVGWGSLYFLSKNKTRSKKVLGGTEEGEVFNPRLARELS